jgi:hypothetical protein
MITYIKTPKESTVKLLELVGSARLPDSRYTQKNQLYLYILAVNTWMLKLGYQLQDWHVTQW